MELFIPRVVISGVKLNQMALSLKTPVDTRLVNDNGTFYVTSNDGIMKTSLGVEFLNLNVTAFSKDVKTGYGDMTQEQTIQFVHDFLKFVYCV